MLCLHSLDIDRVQRLADSQRGAFEVVVPVLVAETDDSLVFRVPKIGEALWPILELLWVVADDPCAVLPWFKGRRAQTRQHILQAGNGLLVEIVQKFHGGEFERDCIIHVRHIHGRARQTTAGDDLRTPLVERIEIADDIVPGLFDDRRFEELHGAIVPVATPNSRR